MLSSLSVFGIICSPESRRHRVGSDISSAIKIVGDSSFSRKQITMLRVGVLHRILSFTVWHSSSWFFRRHFHAVEISTWRTNFSHKTLSAIESSFASATPALKRFYSLESFVANYSFGFGYLTIFQLTIVWYSLTPSYHDKSAVWERNLESKVFFIKSFGVAARRNGVVLELIFHNWKTFRFGSFLNGKSLCA